MDNISTICQMVAVCRRDLVCDILYKRVGEVMPDLTLPLFVFQCFARFESITVACTICWLDGSVLKRWDGQQRTSLNQSDRLMTRMAGLLSISNEYSITFIETLVPLFGSALQFFHFTSQVNVLS